MPAPVPTVSVTILGREYQISCPPEEEEALRRSARYLDKQMTEVRNRGGSSLAYEKVAVMAALNIAHDLLMQNQQADSKVHDSARDIRQLEQKIDAILLSCRQIEI